VTATATPMQYLDKAMNGLHDLGLVPQDAKTHEEPIVALLNQISALDEGRVAAIARPSARPRCSTRWSASRSRPWI